MSGFMAADLKGIWVFMDFWNTHDQMSRKILEKSIYPMQWINVYTKNIQ